MRGKELVLKKAISLMLALLLLSSCSSRQPENPEDRTEELQPTEAKDAPALPETETENPLDSLPTVDYGGADYKMLCDTSASWWKTSFYSEGLTGEIINDTVHARNQFAESRYNVTISYEGTESAAGMLHKDIAAGAGDYSVMWELLNRTLTPAQMGELLNLNDIPTLDMTGRGWDADSVSALSINGKLYYVCNDINIHTMEGCSAAFFAKDQVVNNQLENPYDLVRESRWTLDSMWKMMETVSGDTNGSGERDEGDTFGLVTGVGSYMFLLNGAGGHLVIRETGNDGNDTFRMIVGTEEIINISEKVCSMLRDGNRTVLVNYDAWGNDAFNNGQALFKIMFIGDLSGMRDKMESDFGVLPLPMLNENQERYVCTVESTSHCMSVPATVPASDTERIGVITEALALYSDLYLVDAYYNTTLKGKIARDEDTTEMLDILVNNRTFEYSILYQNWGVWGSYLPYVEKNGSEDLASMAQSIQKVFDRSVQKTIEAYAENGR